MLDFVREPLLFQPRGDLIVTAKLSNQVRRIAIRRALDERCRRYEIEQSVRFSYRVARDRLPIECCQATIAAGFQESASVHRTSKNHAYAQGQCFGRSTWGYLLSF